MRKETNSTNAVCPYCKRQLAVRHASFSKYPLYTSKGGEVEYVFQILQCNSCLVEFIYIWKDGVILLTHDIGYVHIISEVEKQ